MITIKICGLQTSEHALAAATAGADMIGLMFAPSKRRVNSKQASSIVAALREHPRGHHVKVVGVFVNESPQTMNTIAARVGLDYVQLSGDEWPEATHDLDVPSLAAIRLDGSAREQAWKDIDQTLLLIDAHIPGSYGGSGQCADWTKAALLAAQRPVFLAGGLNPENVAQAIATVQPWGVDVSSGVETGGIKDSAKIHAFVAAARHTDT